MQELQVYVPPASLSADLPSVMRRALNDARDAVLAEGNPR